MSWQARLLANTEGSKQKISSIMHVATWLFEAQEPAMPSNRKLLATLKHSLEKQPIILSFDLPSNTSSSIDKIRGDTKVQWH